MFANKAAARKGLGCVGRVRRSGGGHQMDENWLGFLSDLPHPAVLMQACARKVEWPANCRGLPVSSSSGQDFFLRMSLKAEGTQDPMVS